MASQKALYDLCGIKFKSKFSILAVSKKNWASLMLLKLGFWSLCRNLLSRSQEETPSMIHIMYVASSHSYEHYNTKYGANVQKYIGFLK